VALLESRQVNILRHIAPVVLFLSVPAIAEHPVFDGIRSAQLIRNGVPAETAIKARTTAAEFLARHVKIRDGNHHFEFRSGTPGRWVEAKGLKLSRVTPQSVNNADKANGIAETYFVSVDCEIYRTYNPKTTQWSIWHNGPNPFLPAAIKVNRGTNDQWSAHSPTLSGLIAFSAHGNPNLIPTESTTDPQTRTLSPSSTATRSPSQNPASTGTTKTPSPSNTNPSTANLAKGLISLSILALVGMAGLSSLFFLALKILRRKQNSSSRQQGWASASSSASLPPPLPDAPILPEIHLYRANSHLLTPAEQAFHAILEPLVRNSCSISAKVRLADLFSVTPGLGQQAAFNRISAKHIDFVLTEPATSRILCAIELDDSSHDRTDRVERDDFVNELFAANGMPLLRIPFSWTYNIPGLRSELLRAGLVLSNAA